MRGAVINKLVLGSQHSDVRVKIPRTFLSRKIVFPLEPVAVREVLTHPLTTLLPEWSQHPL